MQATIQHPSPIASTLPELLSEKHRTAYGISRSAWYQILKRSDAPVVRIGERKFLHRALFEEWLKKQAGGHQEV